MPSTDDAAGPLAHLPRHAALVERLRRAVEADDELRWFEIGCSIGRGTADELSDIDAAVGYASALDDDQIEAAGTDLVARGGSFADILVHRDPAWPAGTSRFAVEYDDDVQLDLVLMPAARRPGLPDGSFAPVDKDGRLDGPWRPPVADPPSAETAREWTILAWWAVSDAAKYLRRGSWFEAEARIAAARGHALQLHAVARGVPYPAFGLVSLLDFPPFELPDRLGATYGDPTDPASVLAAAEAVADLLRTASTGAGLALGADLSTPCAAIAVRRLGEAAAHIPGG